jgi:methionyl aminopeptidase
MISIKNSSEIAKMRESNRIVAVLLEKFKALVKPGVNTLELDEFAEKFIRSQGGKPAFKGYTVPGLNPFPGSICASVNSCIVHGIPSKKVILNEGDIIGIDIGVLKNGYYGDAAYTYKVGEVSNEISKLMNATQESLMLAIEQAKAGNRVGDISFAIEQHVYNNGYHVADNLTGHGIGTKLHEDPSVPNFGQSGKGPRLKKGMTIAIEPMVNIGTNCVNENGWEFYTKDNSYSAHYEHTILITDGDAEILSKP